MKWTFVLLPVFMGLIVGCQLAPTVPERPDPRIAFMTDRDGNFEIYVMERDGSNPVNLTNDVDTNEGLPSWSAEADAFAYVNDQGVAGLSVYRMDSAGEDEAALNETLPTDSGPPIWSPTGEWIAFGSGSGDGNAEVYVVDAAGEEVINLTNHPSQDTFGSWTPDGKTVFFVSDRDGTLV
ncbi:MAG: hypothetical protein OES12_09765, partial [Anaerolineae bacterium]|nr:hypothetical protein [Anaerolineae bacterium]